MARKQTFVNDMVMDCDDDDVAYYCSSARNCANNNDDDDDGYMSESPSDYDEAYDNEMLTFDEALSCGDVVTTISINGKPQATTPVAQPAYCHNPVLPTLQTHGKRPFRRSSSFRSNDSDSDEDVNSW